MTLASTYTLVYYLMSHFYNFPHIEEYGVVPPNHFISLNYLSTFTDRYTPCLYNINV